MVDDSSPPPQPSPTKIVPQFIARIRDPESVAPPSLSPTPPPVPSSHLEQVLALIVDCIGAIKSKFGYMQDIIEGCKPSIPQVGPGFKAGPSQAPPPTPDVSFPPQARVDDDQQDFPELQGTGRKAICKNNARVQILEQNAAVPGVLAQGNNGHIPICSRIALSFTSVTTNKNIHNHATASASAKQARKTQKRNLFRHMRPGYSNAPMGFTDVVVIRNAGVEDRVIETSFRKCSPTDIAQAAQWELNCLTGNPPIILRGKWLETVQKTGNFIYRLTGNLSLEIVHSYSATLGLIFPGENLVVPTRGWTCVKTLQGLKILDVSTVCCECNDQ
jgi:hypothetical protein